MINYLFLCMNWYVNLNGQTKLEIDGLTDRRAALFKGNIAGAADLKDLVVAHQIDEFIAPNASAAARMSLRVLESFFSLMSISSQLTEVSGVNSLMEQTSGSL